MKYETAIEDIWIVPKARGFRVACCDCGLVHEMDFRIKNRGVQIKFVRRDTDATTQLRKNKSLHPDLIAKAREAIYAEEAA